MKAIELNGHIDEQHRLRAQVPAEVPAGPVRLIVLLPDKDDAAIARAQEVHREWLDQLKAVRGKTPTHSKTDKP